MRLFRAIRGILTIIWLSALIVTINFIQMLSTVLIPFSRKAFMRFNIGCKHFFGGATVRASKFCGNRLMSTGDFPRVEDAIVMANHQCMLDIIGLWMWGHQVHTIGWMKWFVKDEFKYVPGPGWGLKFMDALFVKRNWASDADSIKATFSKILAGDIPFWVTLFPEGTRMKPDKFAASRAYAQKRGLPVFDRVLIPRPKGVWASLIGLRSKLKSVYDLTIIYDGDQVPTLREFFCRGGYTIRIHATRYDVAMLPTTERDFNQWIMDRYAEKDRFLKDPNEQPRNVSARLGNPSP